MMKMMNVVSFNINKSFLCKYYISKGIDGWDWNWDLFNADGAVLDFGNIGHS